MTETDPNTTFTPASLDPNVWYQISESRVDEADSTNLASMLQQTDDGLAVLGEGVSHFWQFQPVDDVDGRYALRLSVTSLRQQLAVCFNEDEIADTKTQPCLADSSGSDAQKWDVASWGDETFRFVNVKNGSDYYMDVHPGNPPFMSSNIDTDVHQPAQHWIMQSRKQVNDGAYSTVFSDSPSSTATSASTTTTSSKTSSTTSASPDNSTLPADAPSKSSSSLSTGAAAGIGIGVALGVIALFLAFFLLWRRRRRSARVPPVEMSASYDSTGKPTAASGAWGTANAGYQPAGTSPAQGEHAPEFSAVHEAPTSVYRSELESLPVGSLGTGSGRY